MPRTSTWYPIELPLRYESITRPLLEGRGYTVALNSRIVLFCSDQDLSVGLRVRVVISWPAKLADGTALSLSVVGRVERSESRQIEIAVCRHEFHTRSGEYAGDLTGRAQSLA